MTVAKEAEAKEEKKESDTLENVVAIVVVAGIVLAIVLLYNGVFGGKTTEEIPVADQLFQVRIDDDPMLGNVSAPVTVIEFADYYCGACADFHRVGFPALKEFIDAGRVRYVFRDYPIDAIHPAAPQVHEAAECAHEQGQYWAFHDALFENQESITDEFLNETAASLGMDVPGFWQCRADRRYQQEVQRDSLDGINDGGVTATPTFFVNGKRFIGNDWPTLKEMIERADSS